MPAFAHEKLLQTLKSLLGVALMLLASLAAAQAENAVNDKAEALFAHIEPYRELVTRVEPLKASMSLAEDPGGGSSIELHVVRFANFDAQFYRYPDGYTVTASLSTSAKSFRLPWGIRIGQSRKQVREILGMPTQSDATSLVYIVSGTNSAVTFQFKRARLKQVRWEYDLH